MYSNNQSQKHAVLACQSSCYIRNSFFANLVNIFDVQSYVEVSLGRIVSHFTWGIELSTLLEEHEKKDFMNLLICICKCKICEWSHCCF